MYLKLGNGAVRLQVESLKSVASDPVLVVVRHSKGVLSWQLPLLVQVICIISSSQTF